MPDTKREIGFVISVENTLSPVLKKSGAAAKVAAKAMKKFGVGASKVLKSVKAGAAKVASSFGKMGKSLMSLKGLIGGFVAFMAARGLVSFFRDSIALANTQRQAISDLGATLAQVGASDIAGASKEIQEFASSLQAVTTVGDETTIAAVNLGLRLGLTKDQAKVATTQALDLAAATGKSLREAMMVTAKAAKGETGALGDLNIKIDATKPAAERAAEAMERLNTQFSGAAAAKARTFAGAVEQLGNTWGDLKEILGGVVTENKIVRAAIIEFNTVLAGLSESLGRAQDSSKSLVAEGFDFVLTAIKAVIKVGGFMVNAFKGIKIAGETAALAVVKSFQLMRNITIGLLKPLFRVAELQGKLLGLDTSGLSSGLEEAATFGDDLAATLESSILTGAQSMVAVSNKTNEASKAIDAYRNKVRETAKTLNEELKPAAIDAAKAAGEQQVAALDLAQSRIDKMSAARIAAIEKDAAFQESRIREIDSAQTAANEAAIASAMQIGEAYGATFAAMAMGTMTFEEGLKNLASTTLSFVFDTVSKAIVAEAALAAARAGSGMFAIPVIGPALAAGAAAAAFGLIKGMLSLIPLATGGEITGGTPGRDSVPALLTPGERVLTVRENDDFKRFMSSVVAGSMASDTAQARPILGMQNGGTVPRMAGAMGGTVVNLQFNSVIPPDTAERKRAFRQTEKELAKVRGRRRF